MSRITRPLLCLLALGLVIPLTSAATTPPAARSAKAAVHPLIGIGDDKADMFTDARFRALGIRTVRYDMSWDALSVKYQRQEVTNWMDAAKRDGLSVLVTIDHSDRVIYKKVKVDGKTKKKAFSQTRVLPTPAQYVTAFKAFRKKFPWVKDFATWDETNYYGEATYNKESLVASYYRGLRSSCSSCTILAAEFLDVSRHFAVPMSTWANAFVKALGLRSRQHLAGGDRRDRPPRPRAARRLPPEREPRGEGRCLRARQDRLAQSADSAHLPLRVGRQDRARQLGHGAHLLQQHSPAGL
jgi:hypothetical protein